jgi:hypothetical protein
MAEELKEPAATARSGGKEHSRGDDPEEEKWLLEERVGGGWGEVATSSPPRPLRCISLNSQTEVSGPKDRSLRY